MKIKDDDMELIRGSGNVFADFGDPDAETKLLKAQMAADIINTLNERGLSVRAGAKVAQVDPADIQRIRNADLSRFTIDRNRCERPISPRLAAPAIQPDMS